MSEKKIRVGLCGWQTSHARYYENWDLIEIDSSFYRLPMLKTAEKWRAEAPPGFTFTMKAWQVITHEPYQPTYRKHGLDIPGNLWKFYGSFRPTEPVIEGWNQTREVALALGCPVVVFQCPVQFTPTEEHVQNMRAFFNEVERGDLFFAWEPRGPDWTPELVASLCRTLNLIHCVDPFLAKPTSGEPHYFRLHGSADYTYQFSDNDLELLQVWTEGLDVYCMFNNVSMWEDAARFKKRIGQA